MTKRYAICGINRSDLSEISQFMENNFLRSRINSICCNFVKKVGFKINLTFFETWEIEKFILNIFDIVIMSFLVKNKDIIPWYFDKTFLLANFNTNSFLKIFFLTWTNIRRNFYVANLNSDWLLKAKLY